MELGPKQKSSKLSGFGFEKGKVMLSYLVGGECAIGGKGNLEGTDAGDWGNNGANQHSGGSIRNIIRFFWGVHKS